MESIMVLGGDKRLKYAADYIEGCGFTVYRCGTFDRVGNIDDIIKCKYIVGPVPFSRDSITLNAPFSDKALSFTLLGKILSPGQVLMGAGVPDIFPCRTIDFSALDDFAVFNAVPTAEGILEIVLRETEKTVAGSRILVTGFGRTGKIICRLFASLGAFVTASARKDGDLSMAEVCGYTAVKTHCLSLCPGPDVIINTVPHPVITEEFINTLSPNTLLIEAASKPGGFDRHAAEKCGLRIIDAPGMPGKTAPHTAGEIIGRTAVKIINEPGA